MFSAPPQCASSSCSIAASGPTRSDQWTCAVCLWNNHVANVSCDNCSISSQKRKDSSSEAPEEVKWFLYNDIQYTRPWLYYLEAEQEQKPPPISESEAWVKKILTPVLEVPIVHSLLLHCWCCRLFSRLQTKLCLSNCLCLLR